MDYEKLIGLPLALQVGLGAGYAGYSIAYAGLRREHDAVDTTFLSLAFGVPALLVVQLREDLGQFWAAVLAIAASVICAAIWRGFGRQIWHWLMGCLRVHHEDGTATAWDALIQRPGLLVQQVSVRCRDGRTLFMNVRDPYMLGPYSGLVLGRNGDVLMVVEEEGAEDGTRRTPEGVVTGNGTRLTYVPAGEIKQVNLRVL